MPLSGEAIRTMNYVDDISVTLRRILTVLPSLTEEERQARGGAHQGGGAELRERGAGGAREEVSAVGHRNPAIEMGYDGGYVPCGEDAASVGDSHDGGHRVVAWGAASSSRVPRRDSTWAWKMVDAGEACDGRRRRPGMWRQPCRRAGRASSGSDDRGHGARGETSRWTLSSGLPWLWMASLMLYSLNELFETRQRSLRGVGAPQTAM